MPGATANCRLSARKLEDERPKVAIKATHERGRGTYGPEKIQKELAEVEKVEIGLSHVKRLHREMTLRYRQVKKYKATTDSNHKLPVTTQSAESELRCVRSEPGLGCGHHLRCHRGRPALPGGHQNLPGQGNRRLRHEPPQDTGSSRPRPVPGCYGPASCQGG